MAFHRPRWRYKYVRVLRSREARAVQAWRAAGWELVEQRDHGRIRTELVLRRRRSATRLRLALVIGLPVLLVAGGLVVQALHDAPRVDLDFSAVNKALTADSDGDGLTDLDEARGWATSRGDHFVTDPADPDTDHDSLSDGDEAGPHARGAASLYVGFSDPTAGDSDGDGLDDATEVDGAFDPLDADTDGDDLEDLAEIEFGSDPLVANADGDHFNDAEEQANGSDPFGYDLTGKEAGQALIAGALFGDWESGAHRFGRLNDTQLESWQYLLGTIASGLVGIGDLRDFVADVGTLRWSAALLSLVALIPGLGDAARVTEKSAKFAAHGGEAARAALYLVERVPGLDTATRSKATRAIVKAVPGNARLTSDLAVTGSRAPAALPLTRPISRNLEQNLRKDEIVRDLQARGYTDIRVNQQQVDAAGQRVGINRPDIQATSPTGSREYVELDTASSGRGPAHQARILSNDKEAGSVCLLEEATEYRQCA